MSILHPEADKIAARYLAPDSIKSAIGSGIDGIVYVDDKVISRQGSL